MCERHQAKRIERERIEAEAARRELVTEKDKVNG